MKAQSESPRVFKTAWFARAARKARITDDELCQAVRQVMNGQCADLGGGVYKKRLKRNMYRSIVLANGGAYWIYEYVFAKKDRDNIHDDELRAFRLLAKAYGSLAGEQLSRLLNDRDLIEIGNADEAKSQQ